MEAGRELLLGRGLAWSPKKDGEAGLEEFGWMSFCT